MLMGDQINMIEMLLKQSLLAIKPITPHNYASLINDIFYLELEQEIEFLRKELTCPETFKDKFRARFREREIALNAIPFSVAPQSITNQLYFKIAMSIFEIKTQRELLAIILPSVTKKLHINIAETLSEKITSSEQIKENIALSIFVDDYQDNSCPDINALSHVVISTNIIFDFREIEKFPLFIHEKIYTHLQEKNADLASSVYSHNPSLQTLADDILLKLNKGTPPKVAIERLFKGLVLGSGRMSSNIDGYAGSPANIAVAQFHVYLGSILSLENDLRSIRGYGTTLGKILDDKIIKEASCVDATSNMLIHLLNANTNNPLVVNPPLLTKGDLVMLEKKYNARNVLNTEKEIVFSNNTLPHDLAKKSLQKIKPNEEELIVLLLNFSEDHYSDLLRYGNFCNIHNLLTLLFKIIKQDFFSAEQKKCLLNAIIENYQRLKRNSKSLLEWAIETNDAEILKIVLTSYSVPAIILSAINMENDVYHGKTVLHGVIQQPALFKTILEFIPEADRLRAVKFRDYYNRTVLHCATHTPELLRAILEFIPAESRLLVVQLNNEVGNNVLHVVADKPESLKTVLGMLSFIPNDQRLPIIQARNRYEETIIHRAAGNPESLKAIIEFLPKVDRLIAFKLKNRYGVDTIKEILEFLPVADRFDVVKLFINSQSYYGEEIKFLNDIFITKNKAGQSTVKSSEFDRIISHINNYLDKFKNPSELINDITLAKIIALNQLKNHLNHLSDRQTLVDAFNKWKNEMSFANPNQSNLELINSADYPGDVLRFFGHSSSTNKSTSRVLLEKIAPVELAEKKSDEKNGIGKRNVGKRK